MARILVSGSVAYDRIMDFQGQFADHFIPDKIHSISLSFVVDKVSVEFGGTAGNIAYNLALLQEKGEIIATAGSDFGSYKSHLLLSGVDPTSIRIIDNELTSSAVILTDKADNQIAAFHPGAGGHAYDTPVDVEGRVFAIIGPGCVPDMTAFPDYYRRRGFKYLYDPGQQILSLTGEQLKDGITGAHVLFASDYEIGLISQKSGLAENSLLELVPTIIVTYGAQGSRIVTREGEVRVEAALAKEAVDPTGAGDAYRAGFMKGMVLGWTIPECAKLASTVASFAVESYGTQKHKFSPEDVALRFKNTYGDKVAFS